MDHRHNTSVDFTCVGLKTDRQTGVHHTAECNFILIHIVFSLTKVPPGFGDPWHRHSSQTPSRYHL